MRAKRSSTFWFFYAAMFVTIALGYFHATRARANEKPAAPAQTQSQMQGQNQQLAQNQNAVAANELNVQGARTTAIGLSTSSPIPITMQGPELPPCWLPTKARSYFFGAYAASSGYKRDPECVKELQAQREHEIAMQELRAKAECSETARRELKECASK